LHTKKWITFFIVAALSVMIAVSGINWVINPYNVFSHGLDNFAPKKTNVLSDRMSKFYIAKNLKPKTIMMGTSRIGLFTEAQLSPYLEGPIYNLSMAGSTIDEQAAYIQYMLKYENIKNVVWSLDFFAFNPTKPTDAAFQPERLSETIYWDDYLISLYSFKTLSRSFKTVKKNLFSVQEPEPMGQPFSRDKVEFNIAYILNQYATDTTFLNSKIFHDPSSIDPKIEVVKRTVQLCRENNVTCVLYTSPVFYQHIDMLYALNLGATFEYWKQELALIGPYTDFCTYSALSKEVMQFRDSSHVIGDVGALVFARIFSKRTPNVPADFGIPITSQTIQTHLNKQRNLVHTFSHSSPITTIREGQ